MKTNPEWFRQTAALKAWDREHLHLLDQYAAEADDLGDVSEAEEYAFKHEWATRLREHAEAKPEVTASKHQPLELVVPAGAVERVPHAVTPPAEARIRGWSVWRKGA